MSVRSSWIRPVLRSTLPNFTRRSGSRLRLPRLYGEVPVIDGRLAGARRLRREGFRCWASLSVSSHEPCAETIRHGVRRWAALISRKAHVAWGPSGQVPEGRPGDGFSAGVGAAGAIGVGGREEVGCWAGPLISPREPCVET